MIVAGSALLKKDVCEYSLLKQNFPDKTTEDQRLNTVERIFREFQLNYNKEDPVVHLIEEMIEKGDVDSLIFGKEHVQEVHAEFRLKTVVTCDDNEYALYKEQEETTGCVVVFSTKLEQYGLIMDE